MQLVNGQLSESISVFDRGFLYGDGLFETILVEQGQLRLWHRHLSRLLDGCSRLQIPTPDIELLEQEARRVAAGTQRGVCKIMITRGQGSRGYRPAENTEPTRVVGIFTAPVFDQVLYTEGCRIRLCETRLGQNPQLAGLKHLNRLEQVMARMEWNDSDIFEGLLQSIDGDVIEGTMSNLFLWENGRLLTPYLKLCGVSGVIRGEILERAPELGVQAEEASIDLDRVNNAEGLFLTNSVIGVVPVKQFESVKYDLSGDYWAVLESLQSLVHSD